MKDKIIIALLVLFVVLVGAIWGMSSYISKAKDRMDRQERTITALTTQADNYKVADSLDAVKVQQLELSIEDFKRWREQDAQIIEQLQIKQKNINQVVTTNTETKTFVNTIVRDSVINDTTRIRTLDYDTPYLSIHGKFQGDSLKGTVISRDSLIVVETIQYRRFLGFLWKTNKVKRREVDIVSKNPHTKIMSVESTLITK